MKLKLKNMKTYILKRDVYNNIDFPKGTVVKIIDPKWEFEVSEGKLKGERGNIADGLNGWLLENTPENKKLLKEYLEETKHLELSIKKLDKKWSSLPTVKV